MNASDKGQIKGRWKDEEGKEGKRKEEKMKRVGRKEGKKRKERKRMTWDFQITR